MARVVIIGGGVMGSATAWQLARRGVDVVLHEQFDAGHGQGSSSGASRIFRFAYPDAWHIALAREALGLWRELEEDTGSALLSVIGGVDHGAAPAVDGVAAALAAAGIADSMLSAEEAAERWPGMRFAGRVVYQPDAGRLCADGAVRTFQAAAARHGADIRFGSRVADLASVMAPGVVVVVTAGAWVSPLVGTSVALPPLTITEEQPAHFWSASPGWPAFIHHAADGPDLGFAAYGLPAPDGSMKIGLHGAGREVDPDHRPSSIDDSHLARLVEFVTEWFPGLDPTPTGVERCLYTSTADARFVLTRAGSILVGSPCSGHGFKFAPAIGRILADLAQPD